MRLLGLVYGIIIVILGAWPILLENNLIPENLQFIDAGGFIYQILLVIVGVLIIVYSVRKSGFKKMGRMLG